MKKLIPSILITMIAMASFLPTIKILLENKAVIEFNQQDLGCEENETESENTSSKKEIKHLQLSATERDPATLIDPNASEFLRNLNNLNATSDHSLDVYFPPELV